MRDKENRIPLVHSRPQSHLALLTGEVSMSLNLGVANLLTHNPPLETLTLREEQMDTIKSPRISDFLILCRQSPLVLVLRLHRLRRPGGSGDENAFGSVSWIFGTIHANPLKSNLKTTK